MHCCGLLHLGSLPAKGEGRVLPDSAQHQQRRNTCYVKDTSLSSHASSPREFCLEETIRQQVGCLLEVCLVVREKRRRQKSRHLRVCWWQRVRQNQFLQVSHQGQLAVCLPIPQERVAEVQAAHTTGLCAALSAQAFWTRDTKSDCHTILGHSKQVTILCQHLVEKPLGQGYLQASATDT